MLIAFSLAVFRKSFMSRDSDELSEVEGWGSELPFPRQTVVQMQQWAAWGQLRVPVFTAMIHGEPSRWCSLGCSPRTRAGGWACACRTPGQCPRQLSLLQPDTAAQPGGSTGETNMAFEKPVLKFPNWWQLDLVVLQPELVTPFLLVPCILLKGCTC